MVLTTQTLTTRLGCRYTRTAHLIHSQAGLWPFNASLPESSNASIAQLANATKYVNILSNPNTYVTPLSFPFANGSDTFFVAGNNLGPGYVAAKANDGLVFYDNPPDNFWSNNQSHTVASWLNFTLPRARTFSTVTIAVYDDSARNGAIACPEAVRDICEQHHHCRRTVEQ